MRRAEKVLHSFEVQVHWQGGEFVSIKSPKEEVRDYPLDEPPGASFYGGLVDFFWNQLQEDFCDFLVKSFGEVGKSVMTENGVQSVWEGQEEKSDLGIALQEEIFAEEIFGEVKKFLIGIFEEQFFCEKSNSQKIWYWN